MLDVTQEATAPIVFGLQVGDTVRVQMDVLVEVARHMPGLPPTWLTLPAGTEGKLLGYREHEAELYAIVELVLDRKIVICVREHKLASVPRPPAPAPIHRRRRPGMRHAR